METQVGYHGLQNLKVGSTLLYKAGMDEYLLKAKVEVTREPGTTGVYVQIVEILHAGESVDYKEGDEIVAGATEVYHVNLVYPKDEPHWVQATRVVSADIQGYVKVWRGDRYYGVQRAGWSNMFMDKSKSDCLVEDDDLGWLKIWWRNADVELSDEDKKAKATLLCTSWMSDNHPEYDRYMKDAMVGITEHAGRQYVTISVKDMYGYHTYSFWVTIEDEVVELIKEVK